MRKMTRLPAPDFLLKNWERWGIEYEQKRATSPSARFAWRIFQKQPVNHLLYPLLRQMTQAHCSYCDGFPILAPDSIDHFRPKSWPEFYRLAYQWENLYLACPHCQQSKKEKYNEHLLRPDEMEYDFVQFFQYDFIEQKIIPNPNASEGDQEKAKTTIEIFGLNHPGLKTARRHSFERFSRDVEPILEDYAFRFMFE